MVRLYWPAPKAEMRVVVGSKPGIKVSRAVLVEDYEERLNKSMGDYLAGRKSRGPEWHHGPKWYGRRKAAPSSLASYVVIERRTKTGNIEKLRIPRENFAYMEQSA